MREWVLLEPEKERVIRAFGRVADHTTDVELVELHAAVDGTEILHRSFRVDVAAIAVDSTVPRPNTGIEVGILVHNRDFFPVVDRFIWGGGRICGKPPCVVEHESAPAHFLGVIGALAPKDELQHLELGTARTVCPATLLVLVVLDHVQIFLLRHDRDGGAHVSPALVAGLKGVIRVPNLLLVHEIDPLTLRENSGHGRLLGSPVRTTPGKEQSEDGEGEGIADHRIH